MFSLRENLHQEVKFFPYHLTMKYRTNWKCCGKSLEMFGDVA